MERAVKFEKVLQWKLGIQNVDKFRFISVEVLEKGLSVEGHSDVCSWIVCHGGWRSLETLLIILLRRKAANAWPD